MQIGTTGITTRDLETMSDFVPEGSPAIIIDSDRRGYDLLCQVETDDGDWEYVRLLECGWDCIEEDEEPNEELIDVAYDEGWLK